MSTRTVPGAAARRAAALLTLAAAVVGSAAPVAAQQPVPPAPQVQRAAPRPVRPESFRVERTVFPGAAGANRLAVDVPLLVGAERFAALVATEGAGSDRTVVATGGLSDLRLYDGAGREVPYLLVTPPSPAPVWQGGRVLAVAATDTTSGFEVDLGSVTQSDRVRLEGLPAPFLKRLRLEGSGDRERWTLLVRDGTLFDLPDEGLRATELEYLAGAYRYLRVTWDDRASAVVPPPSGALVRVVTAAAAPAAPLRAAVPVERRPSEPGKSRFRLTLPGARLPIVALELTVGGGNLLREAQVTEARLARAGEVAPAPLGRATLRRAVRGGLTAASLRVPIDAPTEATIDLVVDDGDNPPLELTAVTAVFATQPFIYFESDSAQRLTARFGLPGLAAPRYDLEAVRESAPTLAMVEARWGALRDRGEARAQAPAAAGGAGGGAPIDPGTFRYTRPIAVTTAGLATLALDTAVLAHSTLADLRIVGPKGEQIPYLLERLDEPYAVELAPLARTERDAEAPRTAGTRSYYRLRLPYAGLPAARLVLRTESRVFERRVAVEIAREPAEGRRGGRTERVADATWRHADPETPAPALTLSIPTLHVAEAVVVVDEGDNSALPLGRPTLLLPAYRLRYFRDANVAASLAYGRADLGAPRYDIALLAPRLLGAPADEVTMGPERQAPPAAADLLPTWIFWGVLAGAVVALLLLIARLVRQSDAPPAPPASPPPAPAVEGTA